LNIGSSDAAFVSERIAMLPGKDNREDPVYVSLAKNTIAVRGYDTAMQTATELRLEEESFFTGSNVVMSLNRKFLKNALDFGMVRLGFDPKGPTPIVGYCDKKTFVIMPLDGSEPTVDTSKLTVLTSAKASVPSVPSNPAKSAKAETPIPTTTLASRNMKPRVKVNAKSKGKVAVLDDAMRLRTSLRETLGNVNDLIKSLKNQRRQDKLLRDTVNSLRKLQNV
jgi:hypothetical protein